MSVHKWYHLRPRLPFSRFNGLLAVDREDLRLDVRKRRLQSCDW
jgi:hypothetical protein